MDRFIASLPAELDGELMLCRDAGIAYQADMSLRVDYGERYFEKCRGYEDQAIAQAINRGRIELVNKYVGRALVLDIGIGSGEFIKKRGLMTTRGFDINPVAVDWLRARGLYRADLESFKALTFWDVLEHVEDPEDYLARVQIGGFVFTSLPIFGDLAEIERSKHYRPGEHLYYWTGAGFEYWMSLHGFKLLEVCDFEIAAGREAILSFAFQKIRRL